MNLHTVTIEVVALTDNPDLLHELLRSVLAEGISQYGEYGDLEPIQRLTVHVTTPRGERYKLLEFRAKDEPDAPTEQLTMPGM